METEKNVHRARRTSPRVKRRAFVGNTLERAKQQNGMLLVVDGDAGMGKTVLLREIVSAAVADGGWQATFARTDEIERNEPYSFMERFIASGPVSDWHFMPDSHTNPVELARECVQRLLAEGDGNSGGRVLVIDDAQWVDAESERVLRYMIPRLIRRGTLLVFGVRSPNLPGSFGEFLTGLAIDSPLDVSHHLDPLTAPEISALTLELHGVGISDRSARRILEATGGTFLGVDSVLSSISEREIARQHLTWDTTIHVTMASDSPLLHRFAQLSPEAQVTSELVCLAGHELPRASLRKASEMLGSELSLEEALTAQVLVESGYGDTIMPRHALLAEAIADTVTTARAKPMHLALAAVTSGHRSLLHLIRGADRWDAALHAAVDAYVDAAVDQGRLANAAEILREALALATTSDARTRLIEDLLLVHMQAKTSYFALDLLAEVEGLPLSILHEVLGIVLAAHEVGRELPAARVQQLLAMEPSTADERVALAYFAFMVVILTMRTSEHDELPQFIALAQMLVARMPDDPAELSNPRIGWMLDKTGQLLLLDCYQMVHNQAHADSAAVRKALPGLIERAEGLADSASKVDAFVAIAGAEVSIGALDTARDRAQRSVDMLEHVSLPWAAGTARIILLNCMMLQGDYDAAIEFMDLTEELAYITMDVEARLSMSALRVWVSAITNENDASAHVGQARRQREMNWEGYEPDLTLIADCEASRARGDDEGVLAASSGRWADQVRNTRHGFLTYRAEALIHTGKLDEAKELVDQLAEWRGTRWLEYWGTLDWLQARLAEAQGDTQVAMWHYEAAVRNRAFPLALGLALTDYGNLLLLAGRRTEAAERLDEAVREFERIGADGYLPRARTLLQQTAEAHGGSGAALLGSLTERERQIVAQLVKGRSNNQIAESFVVSVATVRSHVSNVLRKLRLSSRGEVLRLMREAADPQT
ncbi:AAA ATPase-like protein [Leucobacter komagatae]|uniref:AAA ATPase-like protein n=1 Tax=Leucobacter komagatae TaxID=55969 RepID=A0A542Y6K0_9MICO|nr:LuxR family transcriptional regulator [Leucobacter komagatae]TQL43722.1 AAA ATPase-like protein [Leucobacter komagatae]